MINILNVNPEGPPPLHIGVYWEGHKYERLKCSKSSSQCIVGVFDTSFFKGNDWKVQRIVQIAVGLG